MVVRIREVPWENAAGTFTLAVDPDATRAQLMIIASGGTVELEGSFGDTPEAGGEWSLVAFDPDPVADADQEATRARFKTLVDNGSNHNVIGASDAATVWSDGTTIEASPGFALGDTVFYDTTNCSGNGRWIRTVDDGQDCTPPSVILYHEFAHGFRNHGLGDRATEEAEAITDENVFRRAQGLIERSTTRLESGCGCPSSGCCIIATVASGSSTSQAVQQLRRIRDHQLRLSEMGRLVFDAVHSEYYAFSIEIARRLATDTDAQSEVLTLVVEPLVRSLEVMAACRLGPGPELDAALASATTCFASLDESLPVGSDYADAADGLSPTTMWAAQRIQERLHSSVHLDWALVGPLSILHGHCATNGSVEDMLAEYRRWLGEIPLGHVVANTSRPELAIAEYVAIAEHDVLEREMLRTGLLDRLKEFDHGRD